MTAERQAMVADCWRPIAYGAASTYPSSVVDFDDRVGAATLAIVRAALDWDGIRPFGRMASHYAYRAVRNAIRGELRRRGHERRAPWRPESRPGCDLLELRDEAAPALAAMGRIAPQYAEAIRLWADGLGSDEIGRAVGAEPGVIRDRVSNGLKRLRRELGVCA